MMAIVWAIIGFAMVISEFFVPGVVIIFFGLGALLTSVLTALIPGLSAMYATQILIWLGCSVLSLASLRKYFKKIFTGRFLSPHEHDFDDSGKSAQVLETITSEAPGRIRYMGTSWEALSFDRTFQPGEQVWILKQEGLMYYVGEPLLDDETTTESDLS